MKRWCVSFLCMTMLLLLAGGSINGIVDPYFHYHKPLAGLEYAIYDERYQNDGIVKHFDYDAILTGTSMTENFKTSEFDALFQTESIKVPFSGATYKEINENLERATKANPEIRYIVRGLDYNSFSADAQEMRYESYPDYLYDDNIFNDVEYLFNKTVLFDVTLQYVILHTRDGGVTTSFDAYKNWNKTVTFGRAAVLSQYNRPEKEEPVEYTPLNPENIEQNVLALAEANPQIEFYLFFTPYSIVFFDSLSQRGILDNYLLQEKEAIELMLPYENIHLFSFFDDFELITGLDHYKDTIHYSEDINSYILQCMADGEHELTAENYEEFCENVWDFYTTYDYDELFEE